MILHLPRDLSSWCYLGAAVAAGVEVARELRGRTVNWQALAILLLAAGLLLIGY